MVSHQQSHLVPGVKIEDDHITPAHMNLRAQLEFKEELDARVIFEDLGIISESNILENAEFI